MHTASSPPLIAGLSEIASEYDGAPWDLSIG